MESGELRTRFGRCPYCRAMIYQDPEAVIYYCSKCRTPIRGKNAEPTNDTNHALSRLEILSPDTASVFSDELDVHGDNQPPLFSNPNSCSSLAPNSRGDARVYSNGHDERRPSSRRTRRSACSDSFVLRYGVFMSSARSETEQAFSSSSPRSACGRRRRRSLVGLQELEASTAGWSRPPPPPSPLADPAFQRDLLRSLDDLRGLIASIEQPASSTGGARVAAARRGARFFRRLETHLSSRLEFPMRRNAGGSAGSLSRSSASSAEVGGGGEQRRRQHCRPVLGGAPFVVCGGCSELLMAPAAILLSRRRLARMRCGGCDEVLEVTAPAGVAGSSAPHQTKTSPTSLSTLPASDDRGSCNGSERGGGAQPLPLPLHRALGYSSPSQLLQSRRY
ncbi:unnamed protein product [Urochloa decumbens]|uniref:Probable zinc-ribbon domain-containing protein n=1 Tax=Urochloa decumbens TaxID=240449 RepID=A0ABC8W217_9POAL